MAQKELALYVAEQLAPLGEIRYIPMMGGWLFYYREKLIGGAMIISQKGLSAYLAGLAE